MNIIKEILLNQLIKIRVIQNLAKRKHSTGINNDPVQVQDVFATLSENVDFSDKIVLELGPGHTFGILEKVQKANAKEVYAADIMTWVTNIPKGIHYQQYDGKTIPLPDNHFDVIWSWTVFEHLRYPKITVPEIYRLLKKGGVALHSIDLVDHFNYTWQKDALTFNCLKYPEWLWNLMTWNRTSYVNRVRLSEWMNLFKKEGFEIVSIETKENEKVKQFHENGKIDYLKKYSSTDACTMSVFIVVKK